MDMAEKSVSMFQKGEGDEFVKTDTEAVRRAAAR